MVARMIGAARANDTEGGPGASLHRHGPRRAYLRPGRGRPHRHPADRTSRPRPRRGPRRAAHPLPHGRQPRAVRGGGGADRPGPRQQRAGHGPPGHQPRIPRPSAGRGLPRVHVRLCGAGDRRTPGRRGGCSHSAVARPRRRRSSLPRRAPPRAGAGRRRVPPARHGRLRLGTRPRLLRALRGRRSAPGVPRRVRRHRVRALSAAGLCDALAGRRRAPVRTAGGPVGRRGAVLARGRPAGLRHRGRAPAVASRARPAQPAAGRPRADRRGCRRSRRRSS